MRLGIGAQDAHIGQHNGHGYQQHRGGSEKFASHDARDGARRSEQQLIGFVAALFAEQLHGKDGHQQHK